MNVSFIKWYVFSSFTVLALLFIYPQYIVKIHRKFNITEMPVDGHEYYKQFAWQSFSNRTLTLDKNSQQLLFIGDSRVNGLCVESLFSAMNIAISGETLLEAKDKVKGLHNLENKRIVIALGVNDIGRKTEDIIADYKLVISRFPASSTIYISSILPLDETASRKFHASKTNTQIKEVNRLMSAFAESADNIYYLDTTNGLCDLALNLKSDLHNGDGVHLNKEGNLIWAQSIKNVLASIEKHQII